MPEFSIDSRTLRAGALFVAIRGERFDGHAFVGEALAGGALGVIVDRAVELGPSDGPAPIVIEVADTLRALQEVGRAVRRRSGARVVAVTGSAGKTTTKEVTASFLARRFRTIRSEGNLNNLVGLPLSLLALQARPEVAVVELGMSHPGEIRRLVEIAEPEVRVWTNVGEAHMAFFPSREALAEAKAEILELASPATCLVANGGDPLIVPRLGRFPGRVLTFAVDHPADVRARNPQNLGTRGMRATVETPWGSTEMHIPLPGVGSLANVLAATAVGGDFGIPLSEMASAAATLAPHEGRGRVLRVGDLAIIDDSYNSNPSALRQALEILRGETTAVRRVAVLGEMLELGDESEALHASAGRHVAEVGVDWLVAVGGPGARALAAAACDAAPSSLEVTSVDDAAAAAAAVGAGVRPGDVVLVKGSRSVGLDHVVRVLERGRS